MVADGGKETNPALSLNGFPSAGQDRRAAGVNLLLVVKASCLIDFAPVRLGSVAEMLACSGEQCQMAAATAGPSKERLLQILDTFGTGRAAVRLSPNYYRAGESFPTGAVNERDRMRSSQPGLL